MQLCDGKRTQPKALWNICGYIVFCLAEMFLLSHVNELDDTES